MKLKTLTLTVGAVCLLLAPSVAVAVAQPDTTVVNPPPVTVTATPDPINGYLSSSSPSGDRHGYNDGDCYCSDDSSSRPVRWPDQHHHRWHLHRVLSVHERQYAGRDHFDYTTGDSVSCTHHRQRQRDLGV